MKSDRKGHDGKELTERQKREIEYYSKYVNLLDIDDISFDPVDSVRSRPWNSYWYVYELAKRFYSTGKNRLLDFGCGCGITSVRFAKIGYTVNGFDISHSSIDIGRELAKKLGFEDTIEFSVQTAEGLQYPSDHFDIIVGFDILHHVDIEASIRECRRVLKKDGLAIFREPVEVPVLDYIRNTRIIRRFVPNEENYTPGRHITPDEKKLSGDDIQMIRNVFGEMKEKRFTFLSRLDLFLRKFYGRRSSPLEILDHIIFKIAPFSKRFGGDAVFILKKT